MRRIALAASLTVVLAAAACGSSPASLCKDALQAACQKAFDCTPTAQQDQNFHDTYGTSVSDCVTRFDQGFTISSGGQSYNVPGQHCDQQTASNACDSSQSGKVYHQDKAQACVDGYKAATCTQINDPNYSGPAECNQVCQTS